MERHQPGKGGERATSDDKLTATLRTLEDGISAMLDSAQFTRYSDVMSRFHHYSFGNVMLILAQRPEATQVAGYRRWQTLGRQVKKGEQGITILVPHKRVVELAEGEETTVVRSFGVGTVFDVAQTDGQPLPEPPAVQEIRAATDAGAALYGALEAYVTSQSLAVVREELLHAKGYYAPDRRTIAVDSRLAGDQATKTLAHETAHFVAAHRGGLPRADAETVAEGAAYVVLQHYGIDSSGYTFAYVARWAEDRQVLARNLAAIQQTSHAIIDAIERRDGSSSGRDPAASGTDR
jgi:antirestriction protein ArdC